MEALFAQAAAGMAQCDPTGRFVRVNDHFCAILGRLAFLAVAPVEPDGIRRCAGEAISAQVDVENLTNAEQRQVMTDQIHHRRRNARRLLIAGPR